MGAAFEIVTAATLLMFAALILLRGRPAQGRIILAFFLLLVGINFALNGLGSVYGNVRFLSFRRASMIPLAIDPFFLLYLASVYPYPRRSIAIRGALVGSAIAALGSVLLVIFAWDTNQTTSGPPALSAHYLAWALIIGHMVLAYAAAWIFAVTGAKNAPTSQLARHASWLVLAIGVAVLARFPLVWWELGLRTVILSMPWVQPLPAILLATSSALLPAGLLVWASYYTRSDDAHRTLRQSIGAAAIIASALFVFQTLPLFGPGPTPSQALGFVYSLRWVVFASVLSHGLLQLETMDVAGGTDRSIAALGMMVGALTVGLITFGLLSARQASTEIQWTLAAAMAVACAVPIHHMIRGLLTKLPGTTSRSDTKSRLTMYQAALEEAWSTGQPAPFQKRRLHKLARRLRLAPGEAQALAHVVSADVDTVHTAFSKGQEPVPGLIIEAEIGQGSHGRVFAARDHVSNKRTVVKEYRVEALTHKALRTRFWAEVAALERLDHPNIVRLHGHHLRAGCAFLVLDQIDGPSLAQRIEQGPLDQAQIRDLASDILSALAAAHRVAIVHGDVKPSNILLNAQGRALLTDFDLATQNPDSASPRVAATQTDLPAPGAIQGTLAYMSPAQARGHRPTQASDIYALGIVIWEALVGSHPLDLAGYDYTNTIGILQDPNIDVAALPRPWQPILSAMLDERSPRQPADLIAMLPPRTTPRR